MSVLNGVVVFDYTVWSLRYPELAPSVPDPLAQMYFTEATLYCDNTPYSPVKDPDQLNLPNRTMFLYMITAHIAALNAPINGQPSSPLVGRIESAGEGSVNVNVKLEGENQQRAWFSQTKYGLAFWQASGQYRTARYVPGPQRPTDPWGPLWMRR